MVALGQDQHIVYPRRLGLEIHYDNVLWYNMIHSSDSGWQELIGSWKSKGYYYNLDKLPESSIFFYQTHFTIPI